MDDLIARMDVSLCQPGHWKLRIVRHGALVPARIFWCDHEPGNEENRLDRWPVPFSAGEVAGEWVDPRWIWLRVIGGNAVQWKRAEPIEASEYRYLMADMSWARLYAPDEPIANPRRRVDLDQIAIPFLEDR
jgi:hypothetical protein